jgi:hypothetical protein
MTSVCPGVRCSARIVLRSRLMKGRTPANAVTFGLVVVVSSVFALASVHAASDGSVGGDAGTQPEPGTAAGASTSTPMASPGTADYRSGILFMPFLGVHRPFGDAFDLGFRAGFLGGYHVLPVWSVGGELAIDFMNVNYVPDGAFAKAYVADLVLTLLHHVPLGWGELVVGPRLGAFRASMAFLGGSAHQETARGLAYGVNVGVFLAAGDMALGALLGYTRRDTTRTDVPKRTSQIWTVPDVLSVTFAAIF